MRRNLILIFCVLLGLSWYTAISEAVNNPKKVQEHLARAAELEAQGIYVDAVAEYEEALSYQPKRSLWPETVKNLSTSARMLRKTTRRTYPLWTV